MNSKQQALVEEYLEHINEQYRPLMSELAYYADSLGFAPTRNKTQHISIDFRNSKVKKSIMKMDEFEGRHD